MFRTNTRNIETKQWISSTKQRIGLLAALMFFALGAWGQDYSGVYYIASNGNSDTPSSYSYNANNPANNYYLRPAADPQLSDSSDAYYDRTIATMPFLTTNKTSHNDIAVWIVQSTGDGYYNVIHAASGKYVVYRPFFSGTNSRRKAMHLEECATPPEEAKFEINSDTYNNDVSIYFRPISVSSGHCNWNIADKNQPYNYGTGSSLYYGGLIGLYQKDGNGHININSRFKFEPYQVAAPEISFNYATKEVTVTCNTPGALIYCTTNGNLPTTELTPHTSPYTFTQTTPCTVRAIAEKFTAITEATPLVLQQVSTPTIQADETLNYITITSETEGATIYFTNDGTEPTIASFLYTSPLNFTFSEKPIKAIAVKTNMFNSDVASNSIKIKCPKPEIYPDFETNLVNLFCDAEAASIYYTLDGTTPTTNSTLYDGTPFPLPVSGTVKAFATGLPNCFDSDVSTYTITKAATPTIQADNGEAPRYITITTTTIGADIYYTIDGSDPTTESIRYTGPFREGPEHAHVSGVDIKAIAVKPGMFWSNNGSGTVTLTCDPPLITRTGANTFEISSTFPVVGANIYYTTDETEPTTSSTLYSGPFTHGVPCTIKAIVMANGYYDSPKAERSFGSDLEQVDGIYLIQNDYDYTLFVAKANTTAGASGHYKLVANISAAGTSMVTTTFTGLFEGSADADGNFYTISDLDHPMFREINPGITDGTIPTDQGIVRNVILKDVNIANHEGNTGAIACEIRGGACIYNCGILSGSVGGTGNVGGLVGLLQHTSVSQTQKPYSFTRVINCFSYADITSKGADGSGDAANWAAGIVGNNSYESKVQNFPYNNNDCKLKTAVVNCMFYGDITTTCGVNIAPVYGNKFMSAAGGDYEKTINRYDYFLDGSKFAKTFTTSIDQYRASWPADEKYLTHYEYYRSILNSNRLLCTSYVTGKSGENVYQDTALIAKWVRDESIAPYPILKKWGKYPSIINPDSERVWDTLTKQWVVRTNAVDYQGKSFGTLNVTVRPGGHSLEGLSEQTLQLVITDTDTLHHDYGYYKVQLPYYNTLFGNVNSTDHNIRYGGNYTDWVVTGWKITMVNGQTSGATTFVEDWEHGYNFADRTDKFRDLYSVSHRVYAQGGFYYVPEGVTSIEIEAYWGKAFYLRNKDHSIDRVSVTNPQKVGSEYTDYEFTPAGHLPSTFQGLPVYDSLQTAIRNLDDINACPTVYDQAIVLVGNLQVMNKNKRVGSNLDGKLHPFTIMSADFDLDNEPDYCFQFQFRDQLQRWPIQPIRFDFLAVPELGLAIRHDDNAYAIGIFIPQGHFEITETAFMHTTQFEYDGVRVAYTVNGIYSEEHHLPNEIPGFIYQYTPNEAQNKTSVTVTYVKNEAPVILNGGQFEQIVIRHSENRSHGFSKYTSYILMGGHFRMKRFTPGAHTNRNENTKVRLCAVNCIGGEYPEFYLSGIYRPDINPNVSGFEQGNPHCYTNGGKFGMVAGAGYDKILGNVTFKIDHSIIDEFYGGGINGACTIGGNIDVTIDNSVVGKYCGGPKVGNMTGQTVTTRATGTTFGQFYGGGNGGTNYYRDQAVDGNSWPIPDEVWREWERLSKMSTNTNDSVPTIVYDPNDHNKCFNPLNTRIGKTKQYDPTKGYHGVFEFEVFNNSNGLGNDYPTIRTYVHWVQFGTTRTGNVSNTLTNCTVLQDFYGGGNLGFVDGDVVSTLQGNTIIYGSAYGGGYSAAIPTFRCYDLSRPIFPTRDLSGVMHHGELETDSIPYVRNADNEDIYYEWIHETPTDWAISELSTDNPVFEYPEGSGKWYCYTTESLENLGVVSGNTTLNINGNTKIYGVRKAEVGENPEDVLYAGAAYGGGDESAVLGNTTVTVNGTAGLLVSNVYGGGNIAVTGGDSKVEIFKGTIGILDRDLPYTNSVGKFITGRVFAAGKGAYDPTKPESGKQLGLVKGNSSLYMYGGHVLSCLYGGGEISNVGLTRDEDVTVIVEESGTSNEYTWPVAVPTTGGNATVIMTGGVVGLKRNNEQIHASHEIGNVYGSGQGDPNTNFNTWTNVNNASVHISGGRVWGSVFGGGEEGHVLGNAVTTISGTNTIIGTSGETSYDGNVFGGGRGHQAIALTAGTIGGNATVRVLGGHIFGSVFGGGRNGSVGTYLVPENYTGLYGEMQAGNPDEHGLINVYIGGEGQDGNIFIGHQSTSDHDRVGGNVYGGGKGVVENPIINPIAFEFARVRETHVYVAQAEGKQTFIEGSVFGSGEDGHIMGDTYVTVSGGQIGGKHWVGSDATPELCDDVFHGNVYGGGRGLDQWEDANHNLHYSATAGLVYGNTNVTITGGRVCRNVFGGGNLASVGIPKDENSGTASILITGDAIIGVEPNSANRNGIVFGAGKGRAGQDFKDLSFVKNTNITITGNAKVLATVYGSGEDGHVREKTNILIGDATVNGNPVDGSNVVIGVNGVSGKEGNVYGAGRGIDLDEEGHYSPTAGEVGVSTKIEINNGWVKGSVYGGGRTASVGTDEALEAEDNTPADFPDFGHTTIIIGGNARIGTEDGENGYVFGAGKGDAGMVFANLTNVFETNVTIKGNAQIYGSVFGGGEDGHVRSYSWTDPNNPNHPITKQGDTHVFIEGTSKIGADGAFGRRGNVYGGGRGIDQYVGSDGQLHYSPTAGLVVGNTHVTVAGGDVYQNVYGGGNKSIVLGNKTVNIKDGWVHRNIYGGSNEIPFDPRWMHPGLKTVNMTGGKAHKLFGCSHNTIDGDFRMFDGDLEVIGFIDDQGNHKLVYYNNQEQEYEGNVNDLRLEARTTNPTSFVNISGGYLYDFGDDDNPERGSIHGAGLAGIVYGSVIINIGADAIKNSPFREYNVDSADLVTELGLHGSVQQYAHQPSKLQVSGSVFGGADYYQSENNPGDWSLFNVKGLSNIYIDGKGYNMEEVTAGTAFENLPSECMIIDGNIYGSGTHCESGDKGRNIIVRNYGTRINSTEAGQTDWFHHSTRPMGTIQRCDNLVIDHSNFTFSGRPWLGHDDGNLYAVAKVDSCLYIADSSALTLGDGTAPAHMDSIRKLQSGFLVYDNHTTTYNVFSEKVVGKLDWGWIGVVDPTNGNPSIGTEMGNAREMCFMEGLTQGNTLNKEQENIIIFNGPSKLWVRYHVWEKESSESNIYVDRQYYGELKGFFRMLSPYKPRGIESFAYARPKIMDGSILPVSHDHYNMADGGFLSYNLDYNDYLAPGYASYLSGDYVNTNTLQYPYTNVIEVHLSKNELHPALDVRDYRMWVMASAFEGNCWYVDGTRGWGRDIMKPESTETGSEYNWKYGWGLYPDKPKLSVSGVGGVYDGTYILDDMGNAAEVKFDYDGIQMPDHTESDIVFVVGPIKDIYEFAENVHTGWVNRHDDYELKLYRYPGGHLLSNSTNVNKYYDQGGGDPGASNEGLSGSATNGPGPNYEAMLDVDGNNPITLNNVYMDGLYGHTSIDRTYLKFKIEDFTQENVTKPMIETHNGATLSLMGEQTTVADMNRTTGTIVTRGYSNIDASGMVSTNPEVYNYYLNSDGNYNDMINGGGLYVAPTATVNVKGLVRIFENKQNNVGKPISSNVFLPTFDKHLYIKDMLSNATRIGITNPVKKSEPNYKANTFSPVAVADKNEGENSAIAQSAWAKNNLHDDLQWFFGRGFNLENGSHTTYYQNEIPDYQGSFLENKTLFFGWTWNNVVRTEPQDFDFNNIDSSEDLAWLISLVNGLNGQDKSDLEDVSITQTTDLDMQQYVWVPVGTEKVSTGNFAGTFEGRGHLIKNLTVRYIGIGDNRYEYNNYGMFGKTNGATINRTFLVEEHIEPNNMGNLGGLIGMMEGANSLISNSETAGIITSDAYQMSVNAIGGLAGFFIDGEIRNSMAMHTTTATAGFVGGLVGTASDPESGLHNIKLYNSFTNVRFNVGSNTVTGGMMGNNVFGSLKNCYSAVTLEEGVDPSKVVTLVHDNTGSISQCYGNEGFALNIYSTEGVEHIGNCGTYSSVISADELGYMYEDNKIVGDTALFARLTLNAWDLNPANDSVYAHWARPALAEINSDLPVLLLGEFDKTTNYQGNFRSVGTYSGGPALQYGGHVRDEAGNTPYYDSPELDGALERLEENDALFVYGDITTAPTVTPVSDVKISVYEHASIVAPGSLSSHPNTYVGITFDNSFGKAYSSPGINEGLGSIVEGGYPLPRDWHMFSSPLSNAPLGFDYMLGEINTNTTASSTVGEDVTNYFNNPWESMAGEFNWLTSAGSTECANGADNRYWMKTFVEGTQATDGYFPTSRGELFKDDVNSLFIISDVSDECPSANNYRYPYGMDLLTWTEPDYHWINFKRNGPNHWHSDRPHAHLDYKPGTASNFIGVENQNESVLLTGRGYMASIVKPTLLQSHGTLNGENNLFVKLTVSGKYLKGWNLVGNPYHGYLDFNEVVRANSGTNDVLGKEKGSYFYVVYDADKYATKAYVYYPIGGSENGEYASQYLHPHQGFYVKAAKTGNLVFNESMIVTRNTLRTDADGHFRGGNWNDDRPAYPLVNLYLSSRHGCADVTVIEFERPEWGGASKMKELRQGNGLFYAQHDNTHYAALFTEKGAERVPLWFEAKEDDIFTIKWNTANGDFLSMYLIDNIKGVTRDMLINDSYTFEGSTRDYPSRFQIVFRLDDDLEEPDEPEEPEDDDGQNFAFFDGSQWVVTGDGMLDFIDLHGHILSRYDVHGQRRVSLPVVASGMYLFRLSNSEEVKLQKIIVNNQ